MGNCSSTGRAVGVRLEVLTDLGELASDGAEQQAITTAAMQRASSGPRGKQFDLLGFRHKEPQGGEDPQFDARVTFEMAATRVVRKQVQKSGKPIIVSLQKTPMMLKKGTSPALVAQASAQLGTAEKLLCIGENSPVEKVVAAVNELGAPYAEAYYYIDELCSVDMVSAANIITARDAPADERSIAQQVKEDGIAAANRAALQSPARFSKPLDEADVLEKSESKAADVMKPAGKADRALAAKEEQAVRREEQATRRRTEYWAVEFRGAVSQCGEAVFVLDGFNENDVCHATRDLPWLFSLHMASKLGKKIIFAVAHSEYPALNELLLDPASRGLFMSAIRKISYQNVSARSGPEYAAIAGALGKLGEATFNKQTGEWEVDSTKIFQDLFTDFVIQQSGRVVAERLATIANAKKDEKEDIFDLLKMIITRSLEVGHSDAVEKEALVRTQELLAYAEKHFGEQDDLSIDASNMLANIHRRMGGIDQAISIYSDILKETKAKLLLGGGRRVERLAGAHMQMANTLRDKSLSERSGSRAPVDANLTLTHNTGTEASMATLVAALGHYEEALKVSLEGMGHDSLNTQYCRLSLANCLRALRDDCARQEQLTEARETVRRNAGSVALAAKLVELEASYKQGKEHQSRCEVFYRQAVVGLSAFKALDNVSISARLSHASVLMEIAASVDDPFDDTIEKEVLVLLTDLKAHCEDRYGKLEDKHECTIYVHAKLGELNMRLSTDAHVRSSGKHMVQEALKLFADIRLPSTHPRVLEVLNTSSSFVFFFVTTNEPMK